MLCYTTQDWEELATELNKQKIHLISSHRKRENELLDRIRHLENKIFSLEHPELYKKILENKTLKILL